MRINSLDSVVAYLLFILVSYSLAHLEMDETFLHICGYFSWRI